MVATKPRVRASTEVARELGASAMHRWEDYVACGAPQRARRSAMGGLSPQRFKGMCGFVCAGALLVSAYVDSVR